jgi:hypothetical protein
MSNYQTIKAGVTHVYPKIPFVLGERDADGNFVPEPAQKPISDEREWYVWDELRGFTFSEEPGFLYVLTHDEYADGETTFSKQLQKDNVVMGRVLFAPLDNIEHIVTKDGETQTRNEPFPFNLGIKAHADWIIASYKGKTDTTISALVLKEPEQGRDVGLDYIKHLGKVAKACPDLPIYVFHDYHVDKYGVEREGGRKEDYTFSTLPEDEEEDVLEHLLAKFALTMMPAPSYTGKTHTAISMGLSLVTGEAWLGNFKVPEKVRVRYFVPELSAGRFKKFMCRIASPDVWKQHEEDFIVRPLDCDLLLLDSAGMIEKCRGFYVFLDTLGYFMGLDDNNSYIAAIEFAKRINHLIKEGCLGVCGLYHPPKYSKNKKETGNILTLENQILGSAGFGGLLRSCIALRNLNNDANEGLWCYVQGLKNPGLGKPFQIKGFPLEYLGESPYLSELLKTGSKKEQALEMVKQGKKQTEICGLLHVSPNTLTKWTKEPELEFDGDE